MKKNLLILIFLAIVGYVGYVKFIAPPAQDVKIFVIKLEDNGLNGKKIGCNDSVISLDRKISGSNPIQAALEALFAIKGERPEFYNVFADADLTVQSVSVSNGTATVHLQGTYEIGGVCDSPRLQAQLEETILQFPDVHSTSIYINGTHLDDITSER